MALNLFGGSTFPNVAKEPYSQTKDTIERANQVASLGKQTSINIQPPAQQIQENLNKMAEDWKQKTLGLQGGLLAQTQATGEAIDRNLANLLEQNSTITGLSKQLLGSQMAERGVLRSGQTEQSLRGATLGGIGGAAQLRSQAESQKRQASLMTTEAQQSVQDKQNQLIWNLRNLEAQGIQAASMQDAMQQANQELTQFIANLGASGRDKAALMGLLGAGAGLGGLALGNYVGGSNQGG